jgi:hypothetical protein
MPEWRKAWDTSYWCISTIAAITKRSIIGRFTRFYIITQDMTTDLVVYSWFTTHITIFNDPLTKKTIRWHWSGRDGKQLWHSTWATWFSGVMNSVNRYSGLTRQTKVQAYPNGEIVFVLQSSWRHKNYMLCFGTVWQSILFLKASLKTLSLKDGQTHGE